MTRTEGANLRAGSAGTTTRTMFLTEGRGWLSGGEGELQQWGGRLTLEATGSGGDGEGS